MITYSFEVGFASVEVEVDYDFSPGSPPVMYYPNGDGYPGDPTEIDVTAVKVTSINGKPVKKSAAKRVNAWARSFVEGVERDRMEEAVLEWESERRDRRNYDDN